MQFLTYLAVFAPIFLWGQTEKNYLIRTVTFYNVENLFDTVNDSLIFDDERTPEGSYRWTSPRYEKKIEHISAVLSQIGTAITKSSPDIIGLCEIENRKVIQDLIHHPNLRDKDYGVIHFDSPDERGIDVAFLFKKASYLPTSFKSYRLLLFDDLGERNYTRDQLVVSGILDGEEIYFIVNHWPSRRGGPSKSKPDRIKAAQLNKRIIDSIKDLNWNSKIISMGDFNDDPRDDSFKKVLKTVGKKGQLDSLGLFNPMEKLFKKGIGSLAYRDKWNLFDQFFMTASLANENRQTYSFWKAMVYDPSHLKTAEGKYSGYPFRTYSGSSYSGGYSDHFPVYLYLVKMQKE